MYRISKFLHSKIEPLMDINSCPAIKQLQNLIADAEFALWLDLITTAKKAGPFWLLCHDTNCFGDYALSEEKFEYCAFQCCDYLFSSLE